jgi:predicted RNA methylase
MSLGTGVVKVGGHSSGGFLHKLVERYSGQKMIKAGKDRDLLSLVDRRGLQSPGEFTFTREGIFSISPPARARELANIIASYHDNPENLTITDATACNGGDVIAFAKKFGKVNAVEINPDNYAALANNVGLYGFNNVTTHAADYLAVLDQLEQDIVHMDPPWGGLDYKQHTDLHLYLGDTDIEKVVARLAAKPHPPHISLKVPYNFAKESLFAVVPNWRHEVHDMKKFYLLQLLPH